MKFLKLKAGLYDIIGKTGECIGHIAFYAGWGGILYSDRATIYHFDGMKLNQVKRAIRDLVQ